MLPKDNHVAQFAADPRWGTFIECPAPLGAGEDPGQLLPWQNMRKQTRAPDPSNRLWNDLIARINAYPFATSDQCSDKHYRDVFEFLRINNGAVDHFIECGVFQGGLSVLLAGCAVAFNFQLDLIDIKPAALAATYQRIRLTFPESLPRIRLFFGELPNYVKSTMREPSFSQAILHHDGSHRFNTVVNDLASLYFIRNRLHAVLVQDTHLRHSNPADFCFVDAAVAAVFGFDLRYQPIGVTFEKTTYPHLLKTEGRHDIYFVGGRPEGMMIPLAENPFLYPHDLHVIDDLIAFPAAA